MDLLKTFDVLQHLRGLVLLIDLSHNLLFWNDEARVFLDQAGLNPGAAEGRPDAIDSFLHRIRGVCQAVQANGHFHGDFPWTGADNARRWVHVEATPFLGPDHQPVAYLLIGTETAPPAAAASPPTPTPGLLEGLLQALPDGVLCVDDSLRVVFLNEGAAAAFQLDPSRVRHRSLATLVDASPLLAQLDLSPLQTARSTRPSLRRLQSTTPEGTLAVWEVHFIPFTLEKQWYCALAVRNLEPQLESNTALFHAQKIQAIGALASGVAHDFNNILTAILSHLDLITYSPELAPSLRENILFAQASARRGAELVSKLLTFSRHSEPKWTTLKPTDLMKEVVAILGRSIDPRIEVVVDPPPADKWLVVGDNSQLMQVIMNLCLNARDAMPEGGTLSLRIENVVLGDLAPRPRRPGHFLRLTVGDTGQGMPPEVLRRLFEPYFTTKPLGKGTGLGLSISYNIVAAHSGWIEVDSEVNQGTRFQVFLPRAYETARGPSFPESPPGLPAKLSGKETILVVDDDELVRLVVRAVLCYRGYRVVDARDGVEALEKIREAKEPFDLILLDIYMPRLNGWDTLAKIRKVDPAATVILLSGGSVENLPEQAGQFGAVSFLIKPFENERLLRLVRNTLDARQGKAPGSLPVEK